MEKGRFAPISLRQIKINAKRIRRANPDLSQMDALNQAARNAGYYHYDQARALLRGNAVSPPAAAKPCRYVQLTRRSLETVLACLRSGRLGACHIYEDGERTPAYRDAEGRFDAIGCLLESRWFEVIDEMESWNGINYGAESFFTDYPAVQEETGLNPFQAGTLQYWHDRWLEKRITTEQFQAELEGALAGAGMHRSSPGLDDKVVPFEVGQSAAQMPPGMLSFTYGCVMSDYNRSFWRFRGDRRAVLDFTGIVQSEGDPRRQVRLTFFMKAVGSTERVDDAWLVFALLPEDAPNDGNAAIALEDLEENLHLQLSPEAALELLRCNDGLEKLTRLEQNLNRE